MSRYEQKDIFGNWIPEDEVNPTDIQKAFDVCPICGNNPCTCNEECPLGGDLDNNCADCFYSAEYHYDMNTGECVRNE